MVYVGLWTRGYLCSGGHLLITHQYMPSMTFSLGKFLWNPCSHSKTTSSKLCVASKVPECYVGRLRMSVMQQGCSDRRLEYISPKCADFWPWDCWGWFSEPNGARFTGIAQGVVELRVNLSQRCSIGLCLPCGADSMSYESGCNLEVWVIGKCLTVGTYMSSFQTQAGL